MELTKENFYEYFSSIYGTYQDLYVKIIPSFNKFQKTMHGKELFDITIRCNNALINSIKYFNKNNIEYWGNPFDNPDRVIMLACESYIYNLFYQAQDELNTYLKERNDISDNLSKTFKYKFLDRFGYDNYYKLFRSRIDFPKYYKDIQYHMTNFHNLGEEISSFDVEKDIEKAAKYYLPVLMNNLRRDIVKTSLSDTKQFEYKIKLFHCQFMKLYQSLMKLGKYDLAKKLCDYEIELNNNEYNFEIDKIAKKENLNEEQVKALKKLNHTV